MAEKEKSKKSAPMKLNIISNWGDEKVKLFYYNLFKKSQNKGCFLAFFSFLFVKKNKMPDLGEWWVGGEERRREGGEAGGDVGRDNKKYCTYNTFFHSSLSFI